MKTITITISDKMFAKLRTHISPMGGKFYVWSVACGWTEVSGIVDTFFLKVIKAIDNRETEVDINTKEEKNNDIIQGNIPNSP